MRPFLMKITNTIQSPFAIFFGSELNRPALQCCTPIHLRNTGKELYLFILKFLVWIKTCKQSVHLNPRRLQTERLLFAQQPDQAKEAIWLEGVAIQQATVASVCVCACARSRMCPARLRERLSPICISHHPNRTLCASRKCPQKCKRVNKECERMCAQARTLTARQCTASMWMEDLEKRALWLVDGRGCILRWLARWVFVLTLCWGVERPYKSQREGKCIISHELVAILSTSFLRFTIRRVYERVRLFVNRWTKLVFGDY